ncbi:MAG: hypothetical protein AAF356_08265 [Planctomycetota bacterium]
MAYEWSIPAVGLALDKQDKIAELWERLTSRLFKRQRSIAFTGISGIGKTDLWRHLTRTAPPRVDLNSPSAKPDKGTARGNSGRALLTTVPGQQAEARETSLNEIFDEKTGVDGIVHVVANGFTTVRDPIIREQLLVEHPECDTIDGFRDHQRGLEIEDLKYICSRVRTASLKHARPKWLCLAVTKCDLFSTQLEDAEDYYSLGSNHPIPSMLRELQCDVGRYRFRHFAAPVCASLESFSWQDTTIESRGVDESKRNAMVRDMLDRLLAETAG